MQRLSIAAWYMYVHVYTHKHIYSSSQINIYRAVTIPWWLRKKGMLARKGYAQYDSISH